MANVPVENMPTGHPQDKVRVVRVIEYVGPRQWMEATLESSWIKPGVNPLAGTGRKIEEVVCILEVLEKA